MANEIERVNYFPYQFLTDKDFTDEQNYHIQMRKLQNKHTFSPGIVNGLTVAIGSDRLSVTIAPGMAIDEEGRAIIVSEALTLTFTRGITPTPEYVYLTLATSEKKDNDNRGQPVRIVEVPQVTPNRGSGAIRLARLTWTGGGTIENCDSSAGQKATAKGVDLTPYVEKTGGTLTGRLSVGGVAPDEAALKAVDSHVRFFVKGDVAIEGNLYVSTELFTPGGGIGDLSRSRGDLAEVYASRMPLESGEVVCLYPDDDTIVRSTVPNDPLVFGIISTAPAQVLGKASGLGFPVALTGRVPCKVVAENGPIQRGDLLTTSSTPGHAMKARPLSEGGCACLRPGTVIGKALGALAAGGGLIDVFVFLR
jgi:hypothetical protein